MNTFTQEHKILFIAESIDVENSSAAKACVSLITNLHKAGFKLKVLHYSHKEVDLPGIECILIPEKKWNYKYILSRTQRVLQRKLKINLAKYLERTFGFSFTFFNDSSSIKDVVIKQSDWNPDLIITRGKGTSFRPHHALLKIPELHGKWIAYVHDPYPYHFYPPPYKWNAPGYKKHEIFFNKVINASSWNAYPSKLLSEWMGKFYPLTLQKSIIIPHQIIDQPLADEKLPVYFNKENFTLLHAGNLLTQRDPGGLVKGFDRFLELNPQAKDHSSLLLLGALHAHKEMLDEYSSRLPQLYLSNGYVPFKEVYSVQLHTSVNIVLESTGGISPFLPGKFPHCVKANKPILLLGPEDSESKRLLGKEYPFWADVEDVDKIAFCITELYKNWKNNSGNLKLGRQDLDDYFSITYLRETILNILE
ncbi:UDP-glycosyltransferase [Leptobacterium flavescens]|uniref:UDP-glycosyltransferase n=1 Tax=Leptobacterium flavescens TaxID=472055 RepID=A0A6P0UFX4_9FLAO|nr:glycosyltransferase [Leptobacterium flavescens]NER12181.1 UDP-glycosyltransferase [Leptobacterium flavescens]